MPANQEPDKNISSFICSKKGKNSTNDQLRMTHQEIKLREIMIFYFWNFYFCHAFQKYSKKYFFIF